MFLDLKTFISFLALLLLTACRQPTHDSICNTDAEIANLERQIESLKGRLAKVKSRIAELQIDLGTEGEPVVQGG